MVRVVDLIIGVKVNLYNICNRILIKNFSGIKIVYNLKLILWRIWFVLFKGYMYLYMYINR